MEGTPLYDSLFSNSPFPIFQGQETPQTEDKSSSPLQPGQYESLEDMFKTSPELLERFKQPKTTPQLIQESKIVIEGDLPDAPKGTLVASLFYLGSVN